MLKVEVNVFLNLEKSGGDLLDYINEMKSQGLSFKEIKLQLDELSKHDLIEKILFIEKGDVVLFSVVPRGNQDSNIFTRILEPTDYMLLIFEPSKIENYEEVHVVTTIEVLNSILDKEEIQILALHSPQTTVVLRLSHVQEGDYPELKVVYENVLSNGPRTYSM